MGLLPVHTHLPLVDSTQALAERLRLEAPEGAVWSADSQTAGRGQKGNRWESEAGENLCLSILFKPLFLRSQDQMRLSQAMALGVCAYLQDKGLQPAIKWPNDIYIGEKKISGLLIAHHHQGGQLSHSIVGIGLNLKQTRFPAHLPNPTSLALELGPQAPHIEVYVELKALINKLFEAYNRLPQEDPAALHQAYESRLYRKDQWHLYQETQTGKRIEGCIRAVAPNGSLRLQDRSGTLHSYAFQEIRYL